MGTVPFRQASIDLKQVQDHLDPPCYPKLQLNVKSVNTDPINSCYDVSVTGCIGISSEYLPNRQFQVWYG